jgi:hypothetical protein
VSDGVPWQNSPLSDWSICGMNHYHVKGERFLFVSLVKDGICITEEGKDDQYLWNRLWHKAVQIREALPTTPEESDCE